MNTLFDNYDGFAEKFKPKLTTDDCYTPDWCYDLVLDYVDKNVKSLQGLKVVRPFWPGERYDKREYAPDEVVIDNPPFSIITSICNFYMKHNVPFFLFAPTLTLGGIAKDEFTAVVVGESVTYANGAVVSTSFVSNMYDGNPAIVCDGTLSGLIKAGDKKAKLGTKKELPVYDLPDGVLTAARLHKIANAGVSFVIEREQAKFVRKIESMGKSKKSLFGGGWIVSREAAAREAAARAAAARAAARAAAAREKHCWAYSAKELMLIDELSKHDKNK